MNKNDVKAIGYIRVAVSTQKNGTTSLRMQKRQIVEAANHSGLEIVKWFEQVGYEPVTFVHDTLGKALKFCKADPSIKYLVIENTSRISRSLEHFIFWKVAFERAGVTIKVADGSDLDSPIGTFMEAIMEVMGRYESDSDSD